MVQRRELARRCKQLAESLKRLGVSGELPNRSQVTGERFGHHDVDDRFMVAAAKLALDLALPSESIGSIAMAQPDREAVWVRKLFEKAVGGFYEVVLGPCGWRVQRAKWLKWQIERSTANIAQLLPSMQTDIILENFASARRIVIDTKFTSILTKGWHRDESIRAGHLFQIYAYLRSQCGSGDPLADHAEGLLLHPAIDSMVDETAIIQGHAIRFATVNLNTTHQEIRQQLLRVIDST